MYKEKLHSNTGAVLLLIVGILFLAGLPRGVEAESAPVETTAPPVTMFQVRFLADGKTVGTQTVPEKEPLERTPEVSIPGLIFAGWEDQNGHLTELKGLEIWANRTFTARLYPDLTSHAAYLFPDQNGALRPDDPLTADDLAAALTALVVPGGEEYLPEMPEGDRAVTGETVGQVLSECFPGGVEAPETETVTRGEFAVLMNGLLSRGGDETAVVEDAVPYPDLSLSRADAADLLDAAAAHTPDPEGEELVEAFLDQTWEPGFFLMGGNLYCADESGQLLRDADQGDFHFLPDGRYTSGDEELDELVSGLLAGWIAEDPGADRDTIMRKAYLYVRDLPYLSSPLHGFGETGWEIDAAKTMLTKHRGNCYNYAGAFCALARGLGVDAWCVSGRVFSYATEHGWVEANIDGTTYVFDAQQEARHIQRHTGSGDFEMYMMTYAFAAQWQYRRPAR